MKDYESKLKDLKERLNSALTAIESGVDSIPKKNGYDNVREMTVKQAIKDLDSHIVILGDFLKSENG